VAEPIGPRASLIARKLSSWAPPHLSLPDRLMLKALAGQLPPPQGARQLDLRYLTARWPDALHQRPRAAI
jgi:hypothetical protein